MTTPHRAVYIVDGARTPFLKMRGQPGALSASDLAVQAGRALLARFSFPPSALDEVILGCMIPSADEANIARVVALRLGCGKTVPAWTVQRNCASGMQAIDSAARNIMLGKSDLVLAGGTEAMSRAPLLWNASMVSWLAGLSASKTVFQKLKKIAQFRPSYLSPVAALLRGLTDPVVNLSMGQTAENVAHRFHINRTQMDEYAVLSHQRVMQAAEKKYFSEIVPVFDNKGNYFTADDGVRPDSSVEKLATLKPFFDKKWGNVTPGNSSQITDGAAILLLASSDAVEEYRLPVLAKITDIHWAGLNPAEMGLGPVHATVPLLKKNGLDRHDIDYWEINEAFAAQVLGCVAAFEDSPYCHELGLAAPFGKIDLERLNVDGGAIAMGHPVGASGARIILHLAHVLKREHGKRGVATICIGGGQGGSALIENVSGGAAS